MCVHREHKEEQEEEEEEGVLSVLTGEPESHIDDGIVVVLRGRDENFTPGVPKEHCSGRRGPDTDETRIGHRAIGVKKQQKRKSER